MRIFTLDTTLRDGVQGEAVSFGIEQKLLLAEKLDDFGIDYIEGGWPAAVPRDREFFERAREVRFRHARLTAFGAAWRALGVRALIEAATPAVTVFGKSWDFQVREFLGASEEDHLKAIAETVRILKAEGREVLYDAEHFFDGYEANSAFALRTLETAKEAGAGVLCLCDTNGGTLTRRLAEICADVRQRLPGVLGIHVHNDTDLAVANTLIAVEQGFTHVQGCINGYGARCGNANLCSIVADLELKMGHQTVGSEQLPNLGAVAAFIASLANLPLREDQPYVGHSAFAHKGGAHVKAVLKDWSAYQHTRPELVGNRPQVLLSELSDAEAILAGLERRRMSSRLTEAARREVVDRIEQMNRQGYDLGTATGTLELVVRQMLRPGLRLFEISRFEVSTRSTACGGTETEASVTVKAAGAVYSSVASGNGPVNALDRCLRQCLSTVYPALGNVQLRDYRVRVLEPYRGTGSRARVLLEWTDGERTWATAGVSEDIVAASWAALVDAIRLELLRRLDADQAPCREAEDFSWAV